MMLEDGQLCSVSRILYQVNRLGFTHDSLATVTETAAEAIYEQHPLPVYGP